MNIEVKPPWTLEYSSKTNINSYNKVFVIINRLIIKSLKNNNISNNEWDISLTPV